MKQIAALAIAMATIAPAFAQAPDALCGSLDKMLASAKASPPFSALVADWKPEDKNRRIEPLPAGLAEKTICGVYVAGTTEQGTMGGGPHNYVYCDLASGIDRSDIGAEKLVTEAYDPMVRRVRACLGNKGWAEAPAAKRQNGFTRIDEVVWTSSASPAEIVMEKTADRRGRDSRTMSTTHAATLRLRTPNPNHPRP